LLQVPGIELAIAQEMARLGKTSASSLNAWNVATFL